MDNNYYGILQYDERAKAYFINDKRMPSGIIFAVNFGGAEWYRVRLSQNPLDREWDLSDSRLNAKGFIGREIRLAPSEAEKLLEI